MASKHTHIIETKAVGTKKTESTIRSLKKSIAGLATAYIGATGLISAVKGSIDAFAQQEVAEKKLRQAFKGSTSALLAQASAMQKVTVFGDEAIIMQQAFLASIGMSEEQIKKILPVAADLASATGMTLESAVRNTAKTFSGLAGELGELVPQLRDLTPEAMKAGEAVEVMGELFGGAASAEAETFSGSMQQLQNIIGDFGEELGSTFAPAIMSIVDGFKGLISVNASDVLREEQVEFNSLLNILKDVNSSTDTRNRAIQELNNKYKGYIGNLDLEKAKLEDIQKLQDAAAQAFRQKIIDKQFEEELTEVVTKRIEEEKRLFDLRKKDGEDLSTLQRTYNDMAIQDAEKNIENIMKEELALKERQEAFEQQIESRKVELELMIATNSEKAILLDDIRTEIDLTKKFTQIKQNQEKSVFDPSRIQDYNDAVTDSVAISARAITDIGKATNAGAKTMEALTIAAAIADTYAGANKAFAQGGVFGFVQGAAIVAAGLANVQTIRQSYSRKQGQTGFEGVIDEPTQFTVGEGGAAEYVSVTPLEGVNNAGGQGGSIVINNPIISSEFVETELPELIAEAVRKGTDFGMS